MLCLTSEKPLNFESQILFYYKYLKNIISKLAEIQTIDIIKYEQLIKNVKSFDLGNTKIEFLQNMKNKFYDILLDRHLFDINDENLLVIKR